MRRLEKRITGLIIGEPGSGKTTLERRWTDALLSSSLTSIFVLDAWDDEIWDDAGPICHDVVDYRAACRELAEQRGRAGGELIPRRAVWRCGVEPQGYATPLRLAVDEGHVLVVFCECDAWFPAGNRPWPVQSVREDVTMRDLILRGRAHIPNRAGERCAFHWIADTQYPQETAPLIRKVANPILCSSIEGAETLDWIRRNCGRGGRGKELATRVQNLEPHEWIALRGAMPRLAPRRTA